MDMALDDVVSSDKKSKKGGGGQQQGGKAQKGNKANGAARSNKAISVPLYLYIHTGIYKPLYIHATRPTAPSG